MNDELPALIDLNVVSILILFHSAKRLKIKAARYEIISLNADKASSLYLFKICNLSFCLFRSVGAYC